MALLCPRQHLPSQAIYPMSQFLKFTPFMETAPQFRHWRVRLGLGPSPLSTQLQSRRVRLGLKARPLQLRPRSLRRVECRGVTIRSPSQDFLPPRLARQEPNLMSLLSGGPRPLASREQPARPLPQPTPSLWVLRLGPLKRPRRRPPRPQIITPRPLV